MGSVLLKDIEKRFVPEVAVLDKLNLEIAPGELFFLLGPSGCGKSTLLRILSGLTAADSGEIIFDGKEVSQLPPEKRQAAMVFQNYALWPHLTVFENVAFGLRIRKVSGQELKKRVMEALEMVHLADCADRRVPSLSGGRQQRVALARALAVDPPLLLLDEPLSNLDARLRDAMREEISNICGKRGFTALYVTHDRQEALSMADRMGVMKDGKIRQVGTPRELYERPADKFTAQFLGDINFIEGKISGDEFSAPFGSFKLSAANSGKGCGAVRPERVHFVENGGFDAEIISGSYFGDTCQWHCRAAGVELMVREFAPRMRKAGDKVKLEIENDYLLVLE